MKFVESSVWGGYPAGEMAEVYSRIGPSIRKSPVAPPKPKRIAAETDRIKGVIKFYNVAKNYGFIATKDADVYFHLASVRGPGTTYIMAGDSVTLKIGADKHGRSAARDVRLA